MTEVQTLTLEAVKAAGRTAYEAKTLTAQSATPRCAYTVSTGERCVVGAALSDKTIANINQRYAQSDTVQMLKRAGIIDVATNAELVGISTLQNYHDNWCKSQISSNYDGVKPADIAEAEFVAQLYKD